MQSIAEELEASNKIKLIVAAELGIHVHSRADEIESTQLGEDVVEQSIPSERVDIPLSGSFADLQIHDGKFSSDDTSEGQAMSTPQSDGNLHLKGSVKVYQPVHLLGNRQGLLKFMAVAILLEQQYLI